MAKKVGTKKSAERPQRERLPDGTLIDKNGKIRPAPKPRAERLSADEVNAIVDSICTAIAAGVWYGRRSEKALAVQYGKTQRQINEWANRAVYHMSRLDDEQGHRLLKAQHTGQIDRSISTLTDQVDKLKKSIDEAAKAGKPSHNIARALADLEHKKLQFINESTKIHGLQRSDSPAANVTNIFLGSSGKLRPEIEVLFSAIIDNIRSDEDRERVAAVIASQFQLIAPSAPALPAPRAEVSDAEFEPAEYDEAATSGE